MWEKPKLLGARNFYSPHSKIELFSESPRRRDVHTNDALPTATRGSHFGQCSDLLVAHFEKTQKKGRKLKKQDQNGFFQCRS